MTLSGRVVSDAVKKTTQSGREYIHFRMANNEFGDARISKEILSLIGFQ